MSNIEPTNESSTSQEGVDYVIGGRIEKNVEKAIVGYNEEYDKRIQTLQIIGMIAVIIIVAVSPLRLIDPNVSISSSYVYFTIGFIVTGIAPAIIAIFNFMKGRKFCLYLSTLFFSAWILFLSSFFWEMILLSGILMIYFEITSTLQKIEPMLEDVKSIAKGGAYYHADVYLKRYTRFLLLYSSLMLGTSIIIGIFGRFVLTLIQGDILFSIFMITTMICIFIVVRRTLTLDMKKLIAKEAQKRREEELAKSHSKYA